MYILRKTSMISSPMKFHWTLCEIIYLSFYVRTDSDACEFLAARFNDAKPWYLFWLQTVNFQMKFSYWRRAFQHLYRVTFRTFWSLSASFGDAKRQKLGTLRECYWLQWLTWHYILATPTWKLASSFFVMLRDVRSPMDDTRNFPST